MVNCLVVRQNVLVARRWFVGGTARRDAGRENRIHPAAVLPRSLFPPEWRVERERARGGASSRARGTASESGRPVPRHLQAVRMYRAPIC